MHFVLVRHAQSIWNAEDRWQGQSDVPLSEQGRSEAKKVGQRLGAEHFDRIVSSDLGRALETARAIAGERPVQTDVGLREMNLGSWCGLPHAEVTARYGDELRALQRGDDVRIGGTGESIPSFSERVLGALENLEREAGAQDRVLIVTHGGVIRAVMMALLQLAGRERPLIGAGNTSITRLEIEGGVHSLATYNDQEHLQLLHEEGDQLFHGEQGHQSFLEAMGLPVRPVRPLQEGTCAVLRGAQAGRTMQLRRYGVRASVGP